MTILEFKKEVFKVNETLCRAVLGTIPLKKEFEKFSTIEEFFENSSMADDVLVALANNGYANKICTPERIERAQKSQGGGGGGGGWHWNNSAGGGWPQS